MSKLITQFEADCSGADIAPQAVLKAAGVHPSLWWKWKAGDVSPTLKSFEKARERLDEMLAQGAAA